MPLPRPAQHAELLENGGFQRGQQRVIVERADGPV